VSIKSGEDPLEVLYRRRIFKNHEYRKNSTEKTGEDNTYLSSMARSFGD
jgi:hypothetical protein